MNINISADMRTSLGLARLYSPEDSGNAKFNATNGYITSRGFRINYSLLDAFYIYFLEEGTSKSTKHQGYIEMRTVPAISHFLYEKYEKQNKKQSKRVQGLAMYGNLDRATESTLEQRLARHDNSLNYDLERQSTLPGKEWQSNAKTEIVNNEWKRDDYL